MIKIESRQVIFDYEEARKDISFKTEIGAEDYMALKEDINTLLNLVNGGALSPKSGEGDPNTNEIRANYSLLYIDTLTSELYFNTEVDSNTGWQILGV